MNSLVIKARSIARRTGIKRFYLWLRPRRGYEEKLRQAIVKEVKPGEVVWDVGANRGIYTKIFAQITGPTGRVFAFEPNPEVYAKLGDQTVEFPWVRNEQIALSDFDGSGQLVLVESDTSSSLQPTNNNPYYPDSAPRVEVVVMRGDSYWKKSGITPNKIKIDVEGFEEEVLMGMHDLLTAPELRTVFVEVHFQGLEMRGRANAPARIEKLLRGNGMRTKWVGPSHLLATRIEV